MDFDMDRKKTLNALVAVQLAFIFCFIISSFVVAGTANMGFNVVLTGLLYAAYGIGALMILNRNQTTLSVGFLIGVSAMMVVLSLQTAIYWGQLAGCTDDSTVTEVIAHYSCSNTGGMSAVCAFATFLFLLQGAFTAALVSWKDEFTGDSSVYDDVTPSAGADYPSGGGATNYPGYEGGTGAGYQGSGTADL